MRNQKAEARRGAGGDSHMRPFAGGRTRAAA